MSDPISDIRKGAEKVLNAPSRWSYPETIHHPKCRAVETQDARLCNCGGVNFPVRGGAK